MSDPTPTTRRTVLAAGAVAALAGGTLTACGGEDKNPKSEPGSASTPQAAQSPSPSSGTGGGKSLLKSSAVPVGGGTILKEEKLVVTQPTAGSFRCFTAVCTHQGCLVNKVEAGTIDCPCHGSKFEIANGAVAHGPATRPLAEKKISVAPDGDISLA
ncbi:MULTISPECIES: Rieske (2Fe-2S) protein [unclassified Streptomyces]|uniref:Cytochrome bc1 complex Rieske iron-sulfur subunit n=1 Tax=Streptomyces sp. R33 TaxID=3238629 RepID=A0AB39YBC3_9ACTN|nr:MULTISPECIES: Rieske (2Fe-2S) protein [unclassified Streptomyces]KJY44746.1 Rieske (2Fe-2S) protein [Streptomyces sp. NRRL S-444]KOY58493.1 Rieske (2Fe-2S) protein [Streptomyces sp. XY332]THA32642.1 Rieske (2Fe-2S) protein [Streptomyces sp. A1547]